MVIYICDGCGAQVEAPTGGKPRDWYQRTSREGETSALFGAGHGPVVREWHACSRQCIEKTASAEKLVAPF
jgi:hypothetical protein